MDSADIISHGLDIHIPTPEGLRRELERHLQELVEAARSEAAQLDAVLAQQSTAEKILSYAKAALASIGTFIVETLNTIGSLCDFQMNLSPSAALIDVTKGQWPGTTALAAIQQAMDTAEDAARASYDAFRAINALRQDPQTWAIIERFVEDYAKATHSLVLTETGGKLGTHLLFSLATGGGGAALGAARLTGAALGTTRATIAVGKVVRLMAQIVDVKNSLSVQMVLQQKLAQVVDIFARRYLSLPMVKATIKEEQRQPRMAAGLWVPAVRQVPFFGLSYYIERMLNPAVMHALAAIAPEAILALGPGYHGEHKQHGRCAEPVAISRALGYCDRQGLDRSTSPKTLRGSYILAICIDLAGNAHPHETSRRRGKALSFDRNDPHVYPNEAKFGKVREACASCDLLLRRFSIIDLGRLP